MNPNFAHFKTKEEYQETAYNLCSKIFGFNTLRTHQKECIDSVWNNLATFILTPTGSGKSLCYTLASLMSQGLSIVISPLISLMDDQVKKLKQKGLDVACLHSSMSFKSKREVLSKLKSSSIKILFVSVERFSTRSFIEFILRYNKVSLIAIDEAHCVSDWKFFRPSYLKIYSTLKSFRSPTLIFLTATATKSKIQEICSLTHTQSPHLIVVNSIRENLRIKTFYSSSYEEKITLLLKHLKNQSGSGIIYTTTRDEVETLASILTRMNIPCRKYHSALSSHQKEENLNYFLSSSSSLLVATKAFGMGIDKPDIRFVFHAALPSCMEDYFQEIGRAGRDGLESNTYMFYSPTDIDTHRFMLDLSLPESYLIEKIFKLATFHLQNNPLTKQELITLIKKDIRARTTTGIENILDILTRYNQISFNGTKLLSTVKSPWYSIKDITTIISQERKKQLEKLSQFIRYVNTTSPVLKNKIYFNYFDLKNYT